MIVHQIEQRSPEWYELRKGIPTASAFDQIITTTGKPSKQAATYAINLAAELFIGRPLDVWGGNAWTERGREMEHQAIQLYEFTNDIEVRKVGFITSDDGLAGCSPDALVGDDGMIEVKALKYTHHIAALLHHRATGDSPSDFVQQTQGQILLCERQWCDLVFYHPELPLLSVRQTAQDDIAGALKIQLPLLIKERDRVLSELRAMGEKK